MAFANVKLELEKALGINIEWIDGKTSDTTWERNTSLVLDEDGQYMTTAVMTPKPLQSLIVELQKARQIGIRGHLVYFNE